MAAGASSYTGSRFIRRNNTHSQASHPVMLPGNIRVKVNVTMKAKKKIKY